MGCVCGFVPAGIKFQVSSFKSSFQGMPSRYDFVFFYREFLRSIGYDLPIEDELDETDEETDVEDEDDTIPDGCLIETDDESEWDTDEEKLPSMEDVSNSVN